eukprot:5541280-Pyramimonas_sp.AAC.1
MPRGASYKFRRGVKRAAVHNETEEHADAGGARDRHVENVEADGFAAGDDSAEQHQQRAEADE